MFSRAHRFSFRKGAPRRFFSSPSFRIAYSLEGAEGLHAAVVVGKKVDKRAVVRNKIKRSIIAIIKDLVAQDKNLDLVIFAKKEILKIEPDLRKDELEKALKTIHIL